MAGIQPPNCNWAQVMQKLMQIMAILATLQQLVGEIQALCVKNFLRYLFSILFYFTPALNPFRFIDAYKKYTQDKSFIFSCTKGPAGGQPGDGGKPPLPPQDGSCSACGKPLADGEAPTEARNEEDGGEAVVVENHVPAPPIACGNMQ